jgi:hypothetical protein
VGFRRARSLTARVRSAALYGPGRFAELRPPGGGLADANPYLTGRLVSTVAENVLYYGDDLDILRRYVKDETVGLVYLDPPCNSNRLQLHLAARDGAHWAASFQAFSDRWRWDEDAARRLHQTVEAGGNVGLAAWRRSSLARGPALLP